MMKASSLKPARRNGGDHIIRNENPVEVRNKNGTLVSGDGVKAFHAAVLLALKVYCKVD